MLDPRGHQRDGEPPPSHADSVATLFLLYLRTAPRDYAPTLERDRGYPIAFASLTLCDRTYYLRSPYTGFPLEAPPIARKGSGSQWTFTFCDGKGAAVGLQLPAYSEVAFVGDPPGVPSNSGNDYLLYGLPGRQWIMPPEEAVHRVRRRDEGLIHAVPDLVGLLALAAEYACPYWRVRVAPSATGPANVHAYFVPILPCDAGAKGAVLVPLDTQPSVDTLIVPLLDVGSSQPKEVRVPVFLDEPVLFREVD
jgi:hypothetical protein